MARSPTPRSRSRRSTGHRSTSSASTTTAESRTEPPTARSSTATQATPSPSSSLSVGCCTYQGAEDKGGRGFMIVDRKHPDQIKAGYVRDQALQARELADILAVLATASVDGAFVFTFTSPTLKYTPDPRHDFDMASYSLVKTYPDGSQGTTYPDMAWGPKDSYTAVANHYAADTSSD